MDKLEERCRHVESYNKQLEVLTAQIHVIHNQLATIHNQLATFTDEYHKTIHRMNDKAKTTGIELSELIDVLNDTTYRRTQLERRVAALEIAHLHHDTHHLLHLYTMYASGAGAAIP
ncbi:hypothetical protein DFQ27_006288 [Actinomortierella ambigua]|uniref:Uncharacterized protein n=1 Tax=Actinomortierella ambigua TaxID=1343610 RepID=A0A9P6PYZ2_9FUNG|nr:hypothetical protein DFQ27_006288 [Actinomortierella ambigua]